MTKRRIATEPRQYWTAEEDRTLRALYPELRSEEVAGRIGRSIGAIRARAKAFGLRKSDAFLASPLSGRTTGRQGVATRFQAGHTPPNKGLRRPGWAPGRMQETQFKKGVRGGVAEKLWKPVGTERVNGDGYLVRKVAELDATGLTRAEAARRRQRLWRAVHLLLWEAEHGPVPAGHAVVFKNRDKTDIRLDNLELIPREALMRRNSVHNLPAPLPQTIQLLGALTRKINQRARA
jgi:hypothetical protein